MGQIEEDFCSPEVTKLLEEKGFTKDCIRIHAVCNGFTVDSIVTPDAPTHQLAMKWLREVHNIHISVYVFNRELPITNVPIYTCDIATEKLSSQQGHLRGIWKSYEEAVEAALKYSLENLI